MSRLDIPYAGSGLACDGDQRADEPCDQHSEVAAIRTCPTCGDDYCEPHFRDHLCDPRECEACGDVHSQPEACPAYFDGAAALHHAIANGGAL